MTMAIHSVPLLLSLVLVAEARAGESRGADAGPAVIVIENISLPEHLDAFHERARAAMVKVAEDAGWRVVSQAPSACKEATCVPDITRAAGAGLALLADGKYRTGGYDLRVQLWDGQAMSVDQGSCEDCTGPEFVGRLQAMAGGLVQAQNKKRAALAGALEAPRPIEAAPPVPLGPSAEQQPALGYVAPLAWTLVIGGAAAAAGGAYLLWADGQLENCVDTSAGTRACSRERVTHGGLPLVLGGAGVAVLGGALLIHHYFAAPADVVVGVGPTSVGVAGRF
jgi:hypothetical protein